MSADSITTSNETSGSPDVTLASGDVQPTAAHGVIIASNDTKNEEVKTEDKKNDEVVIDIKKDEDPNTKEGNIIKVKYALNKLKNLEVAQTNASRTIKIARLVTDDQNLRYEMNSRQYLDIKEDMLKYRLAQTETIHNGEVTITVEKTSAVEDQEDNNPETQIKMRVTNNSTNEDTNVVVKMYHTNQSIHLQGGRRMGKVTSTSLVADCLEKHWADNIKNNLDKINETNFLLKTMVVNSRMVTRARTSSGDQMLACDFCNYVCNLKHQINTHKIAKHGVQVKPPKVAATKRKSPPNKSPEIKRKSKEIMIEPKKDVSQLKEDSSIKTFTCTNCAFIYSSKTDLMRHIVAMHVHLDKKLNTNKDKVDLNPVVQEHQIPVEVLNKSDKVETKPISIKEVDTILINMAKEEARLKDQPEREEFLDIEKERLHMEAENWRKTAQDLDLDLKSAQKSNEKLVKGGL